MDESTGKPILLTVLSKVVLIIMILLGSVFLKANFVDGQLDGIIRQYYSTGETKFITEYKDGKIDGDHVMYRIDSSFQFRRTYKNDSLVNELLYDSLGNITDHYILVEDRLEKNDTVTTFTFNILNPYFENYGIGIYSRDSMNVIDTLFSIYDRRQRVFCNYRE